MLADDPKLKKEVVVSFDISEHDLKQLEDKISTWPRMKQVVSHVKVQEHIAKEG